MWSSGPPLITILRSCRFVSDLVHSSRSGSELYTARVGLRLAPALLVLKA